MPTTANGEAVAIKQNAPSLTQTFVSDPVEPDPDTFEIELAKDSNGLGITISGYTDPSGRRTFNSDEMQNNKQLLLLVSVSVIEVEHRPAICYGGELMANCCFDFCVFCPWILSLVCS